MKKKIELPLVEPLYSTYHYQGPGTAIIATNPSIKNWYLNQVLILTCTKKFLDGFSTPEISLLNSQWNAHPYFDAKWYNMQFLGGYVHYVIRNLLSEGYYVCFTGIDDFYVKGKSWYHERHFNHDGCICGYNQEDKTYCIYSYDKDWIYRKFWTPQKSFDDGRKAMFKKGEFGIICGIKPRDDQVLFSSSTALRKISEYLDSTETSDGKVYGIVVHDYIAKYIGKLYDGSIPYEKMDRRVLRMIWEHKKAMLQRIKLIETDLSLDSEISDAYNSVVRESDNIRMLYSSHNVKRRDSVLPIIQKKLMYIKNLEQDLLIELIKKAKGNNT